MAISDDTSLEQIAGLLDQALASDDTRVKDALRALLTVTVLCSENPAGKTFKGPFKTLVDDVASMREQVNQLISIVKRFESESSRHPAYKYRDYLSPSSWSDEWTTKWDDRLGRSETYADLLKRYKG